MKFRSPLITLSTLAVALASFVVLIALPPKTFDTTAAPYAQPRVHYGNPYGSPTETPS